MNRKRAIIVDDEALARKALRMVIDRFEEIEIVGECSDGFEAVKAINEKRPDLVFLDIQMPKLDGFDVLELLGNDAPFIVFVTAYDEYALQAFEAHALDYLLKPVKPERLAKTLDRIKERFPGKSRQPVDKLLQQHRLKDVPHKRILVRDRGNIYIIQAEDITYIEAQGDYVCINTLKKSSLKNDTLANMEKMLDPRKFYRIHRSYILNIDYLSKIEPYTKDSRVAILKNGKTLPVSRSGYSRIMKLL
ncbi:MAG: response regulator [Acidobacteriota bacterium]|nr:response regulator [Acidobacteriota bacterium]